MSNIDFDYLCQLANLELSKEEKSKLEPQIKKIVSWVNKLEELNLEIKEEKTFGIEKSLVLRKDMGEESLSIQEVLKMAPESNKNFIKVPKVIESK